MQDRFALLFAMNGGNASQAAKEAGYSEKSAGEIGRQLLEKPHVHAAVLRHLMRLRFRSGVVGITALVRIAEDAKAPAAARVAAARALCEHAGLLGPAKEVEPSREAADQETGPPVDYRQVLRDVANAGATRLQAVS
jgi:phage terminase small subunit